MILFKKSSDIARHIGKLHSNSQIVALVPTMGALHSGHTSLIRQARQTSSNTVCSIFVNPTQFNDPKDFQKYPITIEKDIYLLEKQQTSMLFLPSVPEIYPDGPPAQERYDLGQLDQILEGKFRPGHFQGVCQVMFRLLKIITPDHLFMGQKDYQQCMVIKKLIKSMNASIVFHTCPTVREADGLAMSSRNVRLNSEERKNATAIFRALSLIKEKLRPGGLGPIVEEAKKILMAHNFKIDYVEIGNAESLDSVSNWDGEEKIVALIAAFQNEVRLIDNMVLN